MRAIASQVQRFVVQAFRPGASRTWNDEAWSRSPSDSKRYLDEARQRSPDVNWRMVTRKHTSTLCSNREAGDE